MPHLCTCTLVIISSSPIIIALTDLSNGHLEDMMMPVQESYGQEQQQLERRVREDGGGHRGVEDGESAIEIVSMGENASPLMWAQASPILLYLHALCIALVVSATCTYMACCV